MVISDDTQYPYRIFKADNEEISRLQTLLKGCEWGTEEMCPICFGSPNRRGHRPGCELATAIKGLE